MSRVLILLAFALAWATGVSSARAGPPAGAKLQLFLLAGQSNMAGRGKIEPQDTAVDPHVWTLDENGQWEPAVDPIHYDKNKFNGVGPGRSFGIAVAAARPGVDVGLIPTAVGGVSLDQWKPGGKLYADAVRRAKIAQKDGRIAGILWHQGESDTKPEKVESYPARLDKLIASLRKDLSIDAAAPLVVGQLGVFDGEKNAPRVPFNAMIDQYAADRPGVGLAKSEGLTSIGDNTHFDAKSQRELGRRYAEQFLRLTSTQPPATEPK